MRIRSRRAAVAAALLSFAAIGALSTSPTGAGAEERQPLLWFEILDTTVESTYLTLGAGPELEGAPCMILAGPEPMTGVPVGGLTLHMGPNIAVVPNLAPCWYTATGPGIQAIHTWGKDPGEEL